MSAAPARGPVDQIGPRRSFPRRAINVPVDVITLCCGIPDSLPGRCTDLSEAGVGAMFAGELAVGQTVAVELRLPNVAMPFRARAIVRHQARLRCGLEFVALPLAQKDMIRYWSSRTSQAAEASAAARMAPGPNLAASQVRAAGPTDARPPRKVRIPRPKFYLALLIMLSAAGLGWWQWQRAWRELETPAAAATELTGYPPRLPPEIMAAKMLYKPDPVYPEAAQKIGRQGVVVLDARIAADGSVKHLRAISGPDMLVKPALDAVQYWRFEPYRLDGKPSEVETTITIEFRLN